MSIRERITHELSRQAPRVPAIREMARMLDADPRGVARVYRQLGVASQARPGRPARVLFAEVSVPVQVRIPAPVFDRYSRQAAQRNIPITSMIRAAIVAAARPLKA